MHTTDAWAEKCKPILYRSFDLGWLVEPPEVSVRASALCVAKKLLTEILLSCLWWATSLGRHYVSDQAGRKGV